MDGSAAIAVSDTEVRIIRTTNPVATDKIAQLRSFSDTLKGSDGNPIAQVIDLIADILQDLNEVPLYR